MNLVYPQLNHIGMIVHDIDQAAKENAGRFGIAGINRRFTLHVEDGIYPGKKVSYSPEFDTNAFGLFIVVANSPNEKVIMKKSLLDLCWRRSPDR